MQRGAAIRVDRLVHGEHDQIGPLAQRRRSGVRCPGAARRIARSAASASGRPSSPGAIPPGAGVRQPGRSAVEHVDAADARRREHARPAAGRPGCRPWTTTAAVRRALRISAACSPWRAVSATSSGREPGLRRRQAEVVRVGRRPQEPGRDQLLLQAHASSGRCAAASARRRPTSSPTTGARDAVDGDPAAARVRAGRSCRSATAAARPGSASSPGACVHCPDRAPGSCRAACQPRARPGGVIHSSQSRAGVHAGSARSAMPWTPAEDGRQVSGR